MSDEFVDLLFRKVQGSLELQSAHEVTEDGKDVADWLEVWMHCFQVPNQQTRYSEITKPIEEAFKRRCMHDALAVDSIKEHLVDLCLPEANKCMVQRHVDIAEDFNQRVRSRKTEHPVHSTGEFAPVNLNVLLRNATGHLREAVLSRLMVELLSLLPAVPKMPQQVLHKSIVKILNAQATEPQWYGQWKWPDGFWTPLILAIFRHKRFKFGFTNPSLTRCDDAFRSIAEFPIVAIKAIAHMDDVHAFKMWLDRMKPDWHDGGDEGYAKIACDWVLELNAARCYKIVCRGDRGFDVDQVAALTHSHLYAAPRRNTFEHPPLSTAMRRLMWGQCGRKAALAPPPRPNHRSHADTRERRRSWVRDYLWERVRWLVRVRFWAWQWIEIHGSRKMHAEELADGTVVMLGEDAIEYQEEHAQSNGAAPSASAPDPTLDGELAIEAAKQRADTYRLMEMEVLQDSSDDEYSPKPKKPFRTYGALLRAEAAELEEEESGDAWGPSA